MHLKYLLQSHLTLNEVYLWRITNLMWVSTPCNEFYSLFVCLFLNSPYLSTLLTCCCDCECCATKKFNCLFFIRFSSSVIKQFVFFSHFFHSVSQYILVECECVHAKATDKQSIGAINSRSIILMLLHITNRTNQSFAQLENSLKHDINWEKKLTIKNRNISSTIVESSHKMTEPILVRSRHCEM